MDREYLVMDRGVPIRFSNAPKAKRLFQYPLQHVICKYYQKSKHIQCKCRMAKGLCLICRYGDHSLNDCPFKRTYPTPSTLPARVVLPALPAPPLRRNPEPIGRRVSLLAQQHNQLQRGARAGRGQAYNLSAEEAEALNEVMAGYRA